MAEQADITPAAIDAPPAADALEPDPEGARAVFEEQMARIEARETKEREDKRKADARAAAAELKQRLRDRRAENKEAAASPGDKGLEAEAKEGSVPGSDPRKSVFDAAPGKSLDDVLARNREFAAGKHSDIPLKPKPAQHFVVSDEADLIEVAAKLGLPDHAELGAINGRHNSVFGVQRGERIILPAHYTFSGIEGVVTEGEETEELAGAEATA